MNKNSVIFWVLSGFILLGAIYIFVPGGDDEESVSADAGFTEQRLQVNEVPVREPVAIAAPQTPRINLPEPVVEPEPESEPIMESVPAVAAPSLPGLNESDAFLRQQLREVDGGLPVLQLLASEELVRKFVVFTENLREGNLPIRDLPVLRPGLSMEVRELDEERYVMEESSYQRYDAMIDTFVGLDPQQAVGLYLQLEPLFQEAYAEIGFSGRDFTASLLAVIESVLAARTPEGPHELIRPSVAYHFADPLIEENYSSVEKLLLRMGPENSTELKQALRDFRDQLHMIR